MAKKSRSIRSRRSSNRKHRVHHKPKVSLIKALGLGIGLYTGATGPSGKIPLNEAVAWLSNDPNMPAEAATNEIASITGVNFQNGSIDLNALLYFYGPVIGSLIVEAIVKRMLPGARHWKIMKGVTLA